MTKHVTATLMTAIAVATLTGVARAQEVTVESMPPSVVKTVPACGDTKVAATTNEIKVTFSKDMMTKQMWSWCMLSKDSSPEISNPEGIKYLQDKRTCVLPVRLEPGKTYAIWINTQNQNAFRDTSGKPAVPYLLVFKTE
jgi:RNA polymerase sigma-70 factor (ECF subfamily)